MEMTWEQTKMKEIFDDAQKMKNGQIKVKSYESIESFVEAITES